jgi:hypothetical protein
MSDLLNSASLVLIPSGYKEDIVYSAVPTDGSGDLSFTRASNGTRVNSAGLVEVTPWNLLQQSETFDNATWSKSGIAVTANASANPLTGLTNADNLVAENVNNFHYINQAITFTSDESTIFVYAKANGYTWLVIDTGLSNRFAYFNTTTGLVGTTGSSSTATIESVGNGWYKCILSFTAIAGSSNIYLSVRNADNGGSFTGNGTGGILVYGAQLNIGSTAKPYFPTTDRLNVPRLTYQNGGGGCPSLLLEKQSTNLVVQSNDMTTWTNGAGTMTKNATTSPDGTNNALSFDNSGDCSTFASASNGVYSWSLFVKQGTSATASIDMSDGATGDVITTFTFSTKTFSGTSAGGSWSTPSASYIDLGNGWYRITLTATKNAGSSIGHKIIASGSGYTYVYGAQLEASSYPTSYIPTTSASATRVADVAQKTGISSLFGTNQGTFFIDLVYYGSEQFSYLFDITDSSNVNRFLMYDSNGSGLFYFYDSGYAVVDFIQFTKGQRYKIAVKYNSSGTIWYVNGVLKGTGTVSFAHQMSQIYLGIRYSLTDNSGIKVNQTIVFPTALTNAELASLTTI